MQRPDLEQKSAMGMKLKREPTISRLLVGQYRAECLHCSIALETFFVLQCIH